MEDNVSPQELAMLRLRSRNFNAMTEWLSEHHPKLLREVTLAIVGR